MFQNAENGYTVLRLRTEGGDQITVTGTIPMTLVGERLVIAGKWGRHPSHGPQFEAEFLERLMPETTQEIFSYLSSRAVKGIGAKTAAKIVERFGAQSLDVLENEPSRLAEIPGITRSKAAEMSSSFRRQSGVRRLIEFLASANIRPVIALRMYQYYGDDALQLVQDNPYILVSDAIGATFQEADALALGHGFDDQSAERVAAATLYELAYNAVRGHCFISYRNLLAATSQLSGVPDELVAEANGKVMSFVSCQLDPLFESSDLKATGTGIYQEVFDTVDYDNKSGADVVDTLLDGMSAVGYTV